MPCGGDTGKLAFSGEHFVMASKKAARFLTELVLFSLLSGWTSVAGMLVLQLLPDYICSSKYRMKIAEVSCLTASG